MPALIIALLLFQAGRQVEVPSELAAARYQRQFLNAKVVWTYQSVDWPLGEPPPPSQFVSERTQSETIFRAHHPSNEINTLYYEGRYWRNTGSSLTAMVKKDIDPSPDARTLGMFPHGYAFDLNQSTLSRPRPDLPEPALTYAVADDAGLRLVTTFIPGSNGTESQLKQWIDPDRGWSVVRSQYVTATGEIRAESVTTLDRFGDHWFPREIIVTRPAKSSGPFAVITVQEARINDSTLPSSFSPDDIGVEVGTNVSVQDENGDWTIHGWDGSELSIFAAVAGRVNRGELELGKRYQIEMRQLKRKNALRKYVEQQLGTQSQSANGANRIAPTEWERYVRRFCAFYEVADSQKQKAWSIHDDCKQRADAYVASRREKTERIKQLESEYEALPDTVDTSRQFAELAKLKVEFQKPIVEIFDEQLKPRLQRLLSRAQLEEGELK